MKKQNTPLEIEPGRIILEDMFHAIRKCIKNQAEIKLKITREQFKLLNAISQNKEEVIQKDMADLIGKDKSTILRLIDSLETKELVRRVAGKKQYENIFSAIFEELQQGLNESELNTFYKVAAHIKSRALQFF
jgi:MarR family transcriptional regulator for hemolysin